MPIKRPQLVTGEIYHVVMRGVDKRIIFPQKEDYFRFIHDLFEFNDEDDVISVYRFHTNNLTGTVPVKLRKERKKRKLLVEILAFCLMSNHFHLLLRQIKGQGISKFMRKLGGYATYINKKYEREGHLYQGRFRAVHIKDETQLKNVFVYIHANPIEFIEPGWKEEGIKNPKGAIKFLESYRWSSYLDYIGKKNYQSITNRELFNNILGNKEGCRESVENWILYKADIKNLGQVVLE
ncbi:transposase [Patescibacteria group bacterium]|nr:transposase [Patescibacteria group bacterium]